MVPKDGSRISEHIFFRRLMLAVAVVLEVGLLVAVVWLSVKVWLAVFAGVLLAVFLSTLTRWVRQVTHLPRGWALASVLVVLLGLTVLGGVPLSQRGRVEELFDKLGTTLGHWLLGQMLSMVVVQARPQAAQGRCHPMRRFRVLSSQPSAIAPSYRREPREVLGAVT